MLKAYIIEDYNKFQMDWYLSTYKNYVQVIDVTQRDNLFDNIFYLHPFLCEFVAMNYVWKNNIKSDYIGFFHYRRLLNIDNILQNIKENPNITYIKGNIYSDFQHVIFPMLEDSSIYNDFKEYLIKYDPFMYEVYNETYENANNIINGRSIFICKWDNFCNMCQFMFGFIQNFISTYRTIDYILFINKEIGLQHGQSYGNDNYVSWNYTNKNVYRFFAYILEYLCGLYIEYDIKKNNLISINHLS